MSQETLPPRSGSDDSSIANQALCAEISLLFLVLVEGLSEAILKVGGKRLAYQFDRQLNDYSSKHAWNALTGLADLSELREKVPDVDAGILTSVYLSFSQYARALAKRILGTQLLRSTEHSLRNSLPPRLAALNARHRIIPE
jgi:hypothetical protein